MKFFILILFGLLIANFALAQLPQGRPITVGTIDAIIAWIKDAIYPIGIFLVTAYIFYAGIKYMMAGADTTKVEEARNTLKYAVVGGFVIMGVYVIIEILKRIVSGGG